MPTSIMKSTRHFGFPNQFPQLESSSPLLDSFDSSRSNNNDRPFHQTSQKQHIETLDDLRHSTLSFFFLPQLFQAFHSSERWTTMIFNRFIIRFSPLYIASRVCDEILQFRLQVSEISIIIFKKKGRGVEDPRGDIRWTRRPRRNPSNTDNGRRPKESNSARPKSSIQRTKESTDKRERETLLTCRLFLFPFLNVAHFWSRKDISVTRAEVRERDESRHENTHEPLKSRQHHNNDANNDDDQTPRYFSIQQQTCKQRLSGSEQTNNEKLSTKWPPLFTPTTTKASKFSKWKIQTPDESFCWLWLLPTTNVVLDLGSSSFSSSSGHSTRKRREKIVVSAAAAAACRLEWSKRRREARGVVCLLNRTTIK